MNSPSSSSESAIVHPGESNKSSSPSSPSGKLCIVSDFSSKGAHYAVFIVDLESPAAVDRGFVPSAPTILIDRKSMGDAHFFGFCVLRSTLYIFEKCFPGCPHRGKSVYTYDLSSHIEKPNTNTTSIVDKTMLCPAPEMLRSKYHISAIPTPDGNGILVFSSQIYYNKFELYLPLEDSKFELYLPLKKELPSLKHYLKKIGAKPAQFGIYSFAFISKSVFLIQIKFGVFTIDVDTPHPAWEKYSDSIHTGIYDVIEGGTLWIISRGKASCFPSESSFGVRFEKSGPCGLHTIYDRQGNVFGIVKLQLGISEHSLCAHMVLDVCSFDIDRFRIDKKNVGADARLESKLIKSFKFVLEGYECHSFYTLCVAHIQQEAPNNQAAVSMLLDCSNPSTLNLTAAKKYHGGFPWCSLLLTMKCGLIVLFLGLIIKIALEV